jgi:hypothetical protein
VVQCSRLVLPSEWMRNCFRFSACPPFRVPDVSWDRWKTTSLRAGKQAEYRATVKRVSWIS